MLPVNIFKPMFGLRPVISHLYYTTQFPTEIRQFKSDLDWLCSPLSWVDQSIRLGQPAFKPVSQLTTGV